MEIHNRTPNVYDLLEINKILLSTSNNGESFEKDLHLNGFIEKPWGYEYRVYCDSIFDVWRLHISKNQSTSMHCHILKDTVLICLHGDGETRFLDGTHQALKSGDSIYIAKGVFHQTISGKSGIELIEVENPRNKFDLLRLKDNYGRQNMAYEKKSQEHDLLPPLQQIAAGTLIREHDLHNLAYFSVKNLDRKMLNDEDDFIFISLDVKSHLMGKIHILRAKDAISEMYCGQNVFLINVP